MPTPSQPEVAVVATTIEASNNPYVDWPAIIAGAAIASAISFVLFTFGTAVGLSIASPYPGESVSAPVFAIVLGLWIVWVTVLSFLIGGYFGGRLSRRRASSAHESELRDGMHGALVWALGVLIGAFIATWTVAGAAKTGTEASAQIAAGAGSGIIAAMAGGADPVGYWTDLLFRSNAPPTIAPVQTEMARGEVSRLFVRSATGEFSPDDKTYLKQLVARQSGLSETEASARVDTIAAEFRSTVEAAQAAAEKARKFALLLAFLLAATLAISAAAAWWAAVQGGEHRDEGTDLSPYIGWKKLAERRNPL